MRECWLPAYHVFRRNTFSRRCSPSEAEEIAIEVMVPADHVPAQFQGDTTSFYDTKGAMNEASFSRLLDVFRGKERALRLKAAAVDIRGNKWVTPEDGNGRADEGEGVRRGFLEAAVRDANNPMGTTEVFFLRYDQELHSDVRARCATVEDSDDRPVHLWGLSGALTKAGFNVAQVLSASPSRPHGVLRVSGRKNKRNGLRR